MIAKPVEFLIVCSRKPFVMEAVDIHEVAVSMHGFDWYEEYGLAFASSEIVEVFTYIFDKYGYYRYIVGHDNESA